MEIEYASGKCRKKCAQLADIYIIWRQKKGTRVKTEVHVFTLKLFPFFRHVMISTTQ